MTDLVACYTSGEKSLAHVERLVNEQEWENIFLITDSPKNNDAMPGKDIKFIHVDTKKPVSELIEDIRKGLHGKINDFEIAVNIVSGTGKEHMAILSALLKLGMGIRLLAVTKEGVKEL